MNDGRKNRGRNKKKAGGGREGWDEGKEKRKGEERKKVVEWKEGLVSCCRFSFQMLPSFTSLKGTGSSSLGLLAEGCPQNSGLNGL